MTASFKAITVGFMSASLLAGCISTGVDSYAKQEAESSLPDIPTTWQTINESVGEVKTGWIASFNDPVLSQLVEEAQANNKDIISAASRIDAAKALAKQAGAELLPLVNASIGTTASGNADNYSQSSLSAGVSASWEADIWGKLKSGQRAALASAQAVEADVRFARHSLAAAVAEAYFLSVEAKEQEILSQSIVDSLSELLRITEIRADNGLAMAEDVALSRSDLASAKAQLTSVSGGKRSALRALEVLVGRYPSTDIETVQDLPWPAPMPPAGLPSSLLERRPDILAAERRIAAAIEGVNQAKAAQLPSLSLTLESGAASDDLSNILDPANIAWQAASSLLIPIFNSGALEAGVVIAEADQKQAVAEYAKAALNAFNDVETALDQTEVLEKRRVDLEQAVIETEKALRVAQLRYREGESDLIDVLSVQQRLNQAKSTLISVERAQLVNYGNLNLALGGSWLTE